MESMRNLHTLDVYSNRLRRLPNLPNTSVSAHGNAWLVFYGVERSFSEPNGRGAQSYFAATRPSN